MRLVSRLCIRLGWLNEDGGAAVYWHSQNLTEDRYGRTKGLWRHGRAWLRMPWGSFNLAWQIPTHHWFISFDLGGGDGELFGTSFACGLFALWFHWEPAKWRAVRNRSYQIAFHNGGMWVQWGTNRWGDMEDWSSPPRWRRWNFDSMDFLVGRQKYTERDLESIETTVPTPEGAIPATVRLFESTWRRPRWPFWPLTRRLDRADIELHRPVPIPGKGENSWDCGEDAIYSLTCRATTVAEAVAAVVESYTQTRERHGGRHWTPA